MFQAPNISESLSKSFLQYFNVLLLYSKSIELSLSFAKALQVQALRKKPEAAYSNCILIIDISEPLIQQVNYHLNRFREKKILEKQAYHNSPKEIIYLNKQTKQKRQKLYIEGGIFSISANIILLDLLTETIRPLQIQRMIIFHRKAIQGKLSDKYCCLPWIATLITIETKNTPIVLLSNEVTNFQGEKLQSIVRLMFIKKVVIWPFGRSQIQQNLKNSQQNLKKINHRLSIRQSEKQLLSLYSKILSFCKPTKKSFTNSQICNYDSKNVQFLQQSLLLYSKIQHLNHLQSVMNQGIAINGSIWNSNNLSIMEIIEKIYKVATELVYSLSYSPQSKKSIDLYQLIHKYNSKEAKLSKQIKNHKIQVELQDGIEEDWDSQSNISQILKDDTSALLYELEYSINVYGLNIAEKQFSPFFNPKFIQMIQYFSKNLAAQIIQKPIFNLIENIEKQNEQIEEVDKRLSQKKIQKQVHISEQQIQMIDQSKPSLNHSISDQIFKKYPYPKQEDIQKDTFSSITIRKQNQNQNKSSPIKDDITNPKILKLSQFLYQPMGKSNYHSVYLQTSSEDNARHLKRQIFAYENQTYYREFIKRFLKYLSATKGNRLKIIRKLIKKLHKKQQKQIKKGQRKMVHNGKLKNGFLVDNKNEQQSILLQIVYQQLLMAEQILTYYETMINSDSHNQVDELFDKEINTMKESGKFEYLKSQMLVLSTKQHKINDDCVLNINDQKIVFHIHYGENLSIFSRNLRIIWPDLCIFYHPSPSMARHLAILHAQNKIQSICQTHVLFFEDSPQVQTMKQVISEEDKAFWNIGQARQNLGQFVEDPSIRINQLIIDDDISKKQKMVNLAMNMNLDKKNICSSIKAARIILIDKRQFKSLLPSYLYHHGFTVIPVFLDIGDYILSNTLAIQKKSVHTRDLHESIKSGRLSDQLRRMCQKFPKPYLLIQCSDITYFSKSQLNYGVNSVTGEKFQVHIRRQLIKILSRFPKVKVIWSLGYLNTIQIITELKKNELEPQLNKFKPASEADDFDEFDQNEEERSYTPSALVNKKRKRQQKNRIQIKQIEELNGQEEDVA